MNDTNIELREKGKNKHSYVWIIIIIIALVILGIYFFIGGSNYTSNGPISESEGLKVEQVQLSTQESFPVQIVADVKGTLENCFNVKEISQFIDGNKFNVEIKTNKLANCEEVLGPGKRDYTDRIILETLGLSAGDYLVDINGVERQFTLEVDNLINFEAGAEK